MCANPQWFSEEDLSCLPKLDCSQADKPLSTSHRKQELKREIENRLLEHRGSVQRKAGLINVINSLNPLPTSVSKKSKCRSEDYVVLSQFKLPYELVALLNITCSCNFSFFLQNCNVTWQNCLHSCVCVCVCLCVCVYVLRIGCSLASVSFELPQHDSAVADHEPGVVFVDRADNHAIRPDCLGDSDCIALRAKVVHELLDALFWVWGEEREMGRDAEKHWGDKSGREVGKDKVTVRESGKEEWWEIQMNEMKSQQIGEDMNGGGQQKLAGGHWVEWSEKEEKDGWKDWEISENDYCVLENKSQEIEKRVL